MDRIIGKVNALWRYPVKSLLGESCQDLLFGIRGAEGDRLYAIRAKNGKLGSGKTTRRFQKIKGLFDFKAYYHGDKPVIVFPGGTEFPAVDENTNIEMSRILGEPVSITIEKETSHFDTAPVHIVTTSAISTLQLELPDIQIDERRFRPNLLIDAQESDLLEQFMNGKKLCIGEKLILEFFEQTERCGMISFPQNDLKYEPKLLKHMAKIYKMNFGFYAKVLEGGKVTVNDTVKII